MSQELFYPECLQTWDVIALLDGIRFTAVHIKDRESSLVVIAWVMLIH